MNHSYNKRLAILLLLFIVLLCCAKKIFAQSVDEQINHIINQMTLEEKLLQIHEEGGFNTAANTRLNIPGILMSDGPHGVRNGLATSFPVSIGMTATWDVNLIHSVGIALGKEFRGKGINQMLGPSMDICRDPRYGRSPESGGEDVFLCARMVSSLIRGAQSVGCIATAKHFNANNKEDNRTTNIAIISQRNLMEEYGFNFRTAVQDGGALSVMNAYNLINGDKCAESYNLLTNILRNKWGFPFYVVSDWASIWDSRKAINAGCDIDMGDTKYRDDMLNLVNSGAVSVATIDNSVRQILRTKILSGMMGNFLPGDPSDVNSREHQQLCLNVGRESLVLLKNEGKLLPLSKNSSVKVAVIGPNAAVCQTDASGSSFVSPFYSVTPLDGIKNKINSGNILYAKGCGINSSDTTGFADALNKAAASDYVIYIGGLDGSQEGEGFDRAGNSINLPVQQQNLINRLSSVNKNLICVIESGGICGLNNCIQNIRGLIYGFYPGQEGGNAIADVIFGDYNPGGKLPVTMPVSDSQLPPFNLNYQDDIGCGYRWFDKMNLTPQFVFGFGMSYTTFSFSNLRITPASAPLGEIIEVKCDITNTGNVSGDEVAQLYVSEAVPVVTMPVKQLKGFERVSLLPGETKTVSFELSPNELYYFDETDSLYKIQTGIYNIMAGNSSNNLVLTGNFQLTSAVLKPDLKVAGIWTVPAYPIEGDSVSFLASIVNRGTGPSPEGAAHEVLFSVNGEQVCRSNEYTHSILAGGMALVYGNVKINAANKWLAVSKGSYDIQAIVNPDKNITETIDTNNWAVKKLEVFTTPPVNIALNKQVTVSSVENSGYDGSYAVDGNLTTRWSSQFSDPQYIIIDLASVQKFNEIYLYWEAAYGKEYKIQISNDKTTWVDLVHVTNSSGGTEKFPVQAEARYVRIYGIVRGTQYGYSLYEVSIYNTASVSSVETNNNHNIPSDYVLYQNYPNPFNPSTRISYSIPHNSLVTLKVFDIIGKEITTLVNEEKSAGTYSVNFDASSASGGLSSGVYFYKMEAGAFSQTKKMILLR